MRIFARPLARSGDAHRKAAPPYSHPTPAVFSSASAKAGHSFANVAVHCADAAAPPTQAERERAGRVDRGGRALAPGIANRLDGKAKDIAHLARMHTDTVAQSRAEALHARAYTVGSHVYFASGEYQPETSRGLALLSHELRHVREQGIGRDPSRLCVQRQLAAPPTRLETRASAALPLPTESEPELDKSINNRLAQPWPHGGGQYFASVDFPNLPAIGTKVSDVDAATIRIAVKKALLEHTRETGNEPNTGVPVWVNVEMHLRVEVEGGAGNTNAMIVLRCDAQRNVEIAFAGISVQGKGGTSEPDAVKAELHETRGVDFVETDAQNVTLPGMTRPVTFVHKPWNSGPELALLRAALGLLGGTEQAIVQGASFRRLQGHGAGGVAGFYSAADNSVNLFDAALPVSMDEWYEIGGSFESGGVRTALHEIGHALGYAQAQPQPAGPALSTEQAFRNAVLANWAARNPPSNRFPPPAHIPLPTTYAASGWGEFFAETYGIYRTNPRFLQTAEYQYLFDFFAARFP